VEGINNIAIIKYIYVIVKLDQLFIQVR